MAVQINVAANQAALTASIQAGVQAYNQRFAQNNQLNLTVNQRAFSQPLGRMTGDVKDFEAALAASNARVIAFGASTAVLGGVIRSFKELASVTIDVEKNLADINRVFGLSTSQLQKFSTELFNVGKQTASTFDDASKAALEFSRQGLKAEDVLTRTKDALTLTRLAGIGTANAVDALTSTVNGFAATGVTTTQILNKLVAVEQDYAVGAGDLAEALSRTGQAAQEAGVSLDQLNALVTAAQQSTARGGAVIGNALKTIFTRLQRSETLDQLEAFNIAVRDVQGNILPAVTILQNFAGAYKNLADAQRAQLSEQVAGVYQVNILKAIVGDLNKSQGVYAGALQRGAAATNEAEIATAKLNQTLDALLKQTATSTQQLANNIGKVTFEPLAKYGTEQLKSFVESMNEILEGEGVGSTFANGLLKGIRNVIAGPGAIAAFFTLFKLIQNSFTYLAQALPQIAGITTETQNRKNIEQSILQIMQQQGPASQALAGLMGNQAAQAQLLLQIARQQTAEYQMQSTLAKQLAAQLATQGVRVKGSGGLQVTRAGGYIPAATRMAEVVGAQAGGYAPGRVVSSPVGGVMNTAEDVKYIPGFAQPFINPPAGSKAGRAHRQNAISRTGVDPYMFNGFIPNFANTEYFNRKNDTLTLNATENKPFIIPNNNELSTVADPKKDSVYGLQYKIKFAGSYSKFSNAFDKKMLNPQQANRILLFSSLQEEQRKTFIENYKKYNSSKQDLQVKPFTANTKETINFSKQLQGVKSDTLGTLYELYLQKKFNLQENQNQTSISDLDFIDAEAKIGGFSSANLLSKAIRDNAVKKGIKKPYYKDNKKSDKIDLNNRLLTLYTTTASKGFIPNFAIPMTTASIPWFKKYSSKYKNAAGDADLFKMGDFPTYGRGSDHEYAKKGNANMLSYLHEDFVRSALNIALGSKQVIRPSEVGFRDKPISDIANENDFDLLYRIADGSYSMLELKQDFRNISGSVTGFMNKKLANLEKENPVLAKKVSSMIAVSNRPKFTDPTGRNAGANFSEFEMAAASIVKDKYSNVDPSISAKLTKVTDGLLRRYEAKKNTTYGGFIPNFAYKQAVMGLEESMSGNKAIFDTKPFPHIRNSSQPTFSSAIADHGGLSNALSDSMRGQKAAGLMNKGFVPNFAPRSYRYSGRGSVVDPSSGISQYSAGLGFSLADQERRARDEFNRIINALRNGAMNAQQATTAFSTLNTQAGLSAKAQTSLTRILNREVAAAGGSAGGTGGGASNSRLTRFSKGLSKASTAISLAGPVVAGFAEQFAFGDRQRTQMTSGERVGQSLLSTGLSAATTGAGIGASFGLPGVIIGGTIGSLVGLTSALNAAQLTTEELVKIDQENIEVMQKTSSAGSDYIQKQQELSRLIASGANESQIKAASKAVSNSFLEIKDAKLAEAFTKTKGDIESMSKALQTFNTDLRRRQSASAALSALREGSFFTSSAQKGVEDPREVASNLYAAFSDSAPQEIKRVQEGVTKYFELNPGTNRAEAMQFQKNRLNIISSLGADIEKLVSVESPNLKKDSEQFKERTKRYLTLFFGASGKDIATAFNEIGNLNADEAKALREKLIKQGNLRKARLSVEEDIAKKTNSINEDLEKSDFDEKIKAAIFDFQQGIETFSIDALQAISIKRDFNLEKLAAQFKANSTSVILDFYSKNLAALTSEIEDETFIREQLKPAFDKFLKTGDMKGLITTLSGKTQITETPKANEMFTANTRNFMLAESERGKKYTNDQNLLRNQYGLEEIKSKNNLILSDILEQEIELAGLSQRRELERKTTVELEIDAMERRLADEGNFLGMGVLGRATEKARLRADASQKRISEQAIEKARSAQSGYKEIMDIQRKDLIAQADRLDAESPTENRGFLQRAQAQSLRVRDITSSESLELAISEVEQLKFAGEEEKKRKNTLQSLKYIQQEIIQGKIREEEIAKRINDEEERNARRSVSMRYGFKEGFSSLIDDADRIGYKLGREIPSMFADGMTNALMDVAKGTKDIGDAFQDMAITFGQTLMQEVLRAAIGKALGSIGIGALFGQAGGNVSARGIGYQHGGVIRANNGQYVSGMGSGDRYPAMLENGEYVLNREAVKRLGGKKSLDTFNFEQAPRFASGGNVSMEAEMALNKDQEMDYTKNLLYNRSNIGAINENDYTAYAYSESDYFKKMREKAIANEQKRVQDAFAKKQKNAQLISSLVGTAGSLFLAAGMSGLAKSGSSVSKGAAKAKPAGLGYGMGSSETGSFSATIGSQRGGMIGFNSGGFVPHGSRLSDTIPALLTGGEYVMNNSAVRKYGLGAMNAMNAGAMSNSTNSNSTSTNNNTNNNATNISINIDRSGKATYGSDTNSYEKNDIAFSKQMAKRVADIAKGVISDESRYGGKIYQR